MRTPKGAQIEVKTHKDNRTASEYLKPTQLQKSSHPGSVSVSTRTEVNGAEQYAKTGQTAGMDFGVRTILTLYDGTTPQARLPLLAALSELKSKQGTMSRRVKEMEADLP